MLTQATWWAVFQGAQAVSLTGRPLHRHPHWYYDCVYCQCMNELHDAALAWLVRQQDEGHA
jgi:hypothetical protein